VGQESEAQAIFEKILDTVESSEGESALEAILKPVELPERESALEAILEPIKGSRYEGSMDHRTAKPRRETGPESPLHPWMHPGVRTTTGTLGLSLAGRR
jgi:hypothetical protein